MSADDSDTATDSSRTPGCRRPEGAAGGGGFYGRGRRIPHHAIPTIAVAVTATAARGSVPPEGVSVRRESTAPLDCQLSTEPFDWPENHEPIDWNEPSESIDIVDPSEPMQPNEPTDPMDSTEPAEPIDNTDSVEPTDSSELREPADQREDMTPIIPSAATASPTPHSPLPHRPTGPGACGRLGSLSRERGGAGPGS